MKAEKNGCVEQLDFSIDETNGRELIQVDHLNIMHRGKTGKGRSKEHNKTKSESWMEQVKRRKLGR